MRSDLNPDFQDLLRSLTDHSVDFLIVGAHALAFHGVARYTQDLDLWMRRSIENALKLRSALADFGLILTEAEANQLTNERKFIRFGREPVRVEILNFLDGCDYDEAARRALKESLGGVPVSVLSLDDYVATKRASGRPKDLSDLTLLRSSIGELPGDNVSE